MTRRKVELTYIANDSKRKATLKKRKRGLMKKVDELSTLCGVEACAIVYNPGDSQPEVWPSHRGVQRVITKLKNMPELDQSKKMLNQDSFLKQRIFKLSEQLKKQRNENRKKELSLLMFQYLSGAGNVSENSNVVDLNDLGWLIEQNLSDITRLKKTQSQGQVAALRAAEHGAALNIGGGDMAMAHHGQGHGDTNVNLGSMMQQQHRSMDMINNGGDDQMMPFEDFNGFWPIN